MTNLQKFIATAVEERIKSGKPITADFIRKCNKKYNADVVRRVRQEGKIVEQSIATHRKNKQDGPVLSNSNFGGKTESYFTEKEMINGYQPPPYEELSDSERKIWNKIKFKFEKL